MTLRLYMVELTVADWPAALAWYRDALNLEVVQHDDARRFALLRAGSGHVSLKEGRPEPGSVRLTFEVDDVPTELERLGKFGVFPESPLKASAEGYRRAVVRDPDGHRLCLFDWGNRPPTFSDTDRVSG